MKTSNGFTRRHGKPIDAKRRAQLLAEFDRSGLSSAAFARQHGLHYTTFCGWRHRRAKTSPGFVEVKLPTPVVPVDLVIELGAHARLHITSNDQVGVAVRLIQALNAAT